MGLIKIWALSRGGGGLIREGTCLKFFDRQRQNYTMSLEFEMLGSFNNNHELLHYIANTNKNWLEISKTEIKSIYNTEYPQF